MVWALRWLAVAYVALLPVGRSGLPLNAQWGDLLFPLILLFTIRTGDAPWMRRQDWPLAFYLSVTLLAALVSADVPTGLGQLLKQLYLTAVFLVFRQLSVHPSVSRWLQGAYVLGVAALSALSVGDLLRVGGSGDSSPAFVAVDRLPFLGVVTRLRGGLLSPEFLGEALVVAFVLALALRADAAGGATRAWTAVSALLAAAAFLTFSHSAAGFAIAAACFVGRGLVSRSAKAALWAVALGVVLLVNAASLVDPGPRETDYGVNPVSVEVLGTRVEGRLMHYAALKQVGWSSFLDHPWTGVGPGRFPAETERAYQEGTLTARYRDKPPHCDLTGRLAETGFLGGLSLIGLWISWLRGITRGGGRSSAGQRAAGAAVIGLLVNSLNADVMNFRFLWVCLAWAAPGDDTGEDEGAVPVRM